MKSATFPQTFTINAPSGDPAHFTYTTHGPAFPAPAAVVVMAELREADAAQLHQEDVDIKRE